MFVFPACFCLHCAALDDSWVQWGWIYTFTVSKVMLGVIQLPQASNKTTQCNAWWQTSGVIRTICWTYSRRSRSKVIKALNWSQHLRAMFKAQCEHEDEGVLFQTCSCDAFKHVLAKTSHNSSWMDKYCTVKPCRGRQNALRFRDKTLATFTHWQNPTLSQSLPFMLCIGVYLKTHPLLNLPAADWEV